MNNTPDPQYPQYPWRLDTNSRYKDAIKILMDLSTASLVLPILFLRDILQIPKNQPLFHAFNYKVYCSWACLALTLLFGFLFYYASAKWAQLAWGQPVTFFRMATTDGFVERILDKCFFAAIATFVLGLGSIMWFVVTFKPAA